MGANQNFSKIKFTTTVLRVMGLIVVLFMVIMVFAYLFLENQSGKKINPNLPFAVPAILYLSFVFGWAVAYTKFFRFPKNQKVLLLGVAIGGLIVPAVAATEQLTSGQLSGSEIATAMPQYLLGGVLGAALQLYFLVVVLRYVFRFKLPF